MLFEQTLGLRHEERRQLDRREIERGSRDRRRRDRRRKTLRGVVLGMFAMVLPHHHAGSKTGNKLSEPSGFVSVSEDYRAEIGRASCRERVWGAGGWRCPRQEGR